MKIVAMFAIVGVGVVLMFVLLTGDDDQSKVDVQASGELPALAELNRADDLGADIVRAYLKAALSCSAAGDRLMTQLSRHGEIAARQIMSRACESAGGRPFADRLEAEVVSEDLDAAGRSLWRVMGTRLPDDLVLRVRQSEAADGWEIERPCAKSCSA